MSTGDHLIAAAALIRRDEEILLVKQQGPDDHEPTWALPGGLLETNELLLDGLARELREETGLKLIDPGSLLYVAQGVSNTGSWMAFTFDVRDWTGDLKPDDPDGFILDARFLPVEAAIARLEAIPWQPMREPIIEYLREPYPHGTLWSYRDDGSGNSELIDPSTAITVDASGSV